jgi:hypothetical protein
MLEIYNIKEGEKHFNYLMKGLSGVDNSFLEVAYNNVRTGIQRPESTFVAELYHQLRVFQNEYCFENLQLQIDLSKMNLNERIENTCVNDIERRSLKPDIVLHRGQDSTANQLMICEVKMKGCSYTSLINDLKKLIFYKVSRLQFLSSVFIFAGSRQDLEEILVTECSHHLLRCLKTHDILFVAKNLKKWEMYKITTI